METIGAGDLIEVERMFYNLELTLAEMQQQALLKGKMKYINAADPEEKAKFAPQVRPRSIGLPGMRSVRSR